MSVWVIVTLAIIVINYFWTQVSHDDNVGDATPAWIDRVTNGPWTIANVIWWLFAAAGAYLSVNLYFSGDFLLPVAGAVVLVYSFIRRTPKVYRSLLGSGLSKLLFIPVWAMVIIGLTDSLMVYFSLYFAVWSLVSSVMQGRFIYLTRYLSEAAADALSREEASAEATA